MFDFSLDMSAETLRSVYRKNLVKYHPDKIQSREKRAATEEEVEEFRKMQCAYEEYKKHARPSPVPPQQPRPAPPAPESPKPAPESPKPAPESPKPAPEAAKPKCRCCGVCGQPGHTRTTCPIVNPKKAAQRMRAERNKKNRENKKNTHVPPKETTEPPKAHPSPSKATFVAEPISITFSVKFAVPSGAKAGDVINIPYTVPGPTGPQSMVHEFVIKEHQLNYKNLYATIPI